MSNGFVVADVEEREITIANGGTVLIGGFVGILAAIALFVAGGFVIDGGSVLVGVVMILGAAVLMIGSIIILCGLKVLNPNEALVLTLFGQYYATIKKPGFYAVNPFCTAVRPGKKEEAGGMVPELKIGSASSSVASMSSGKTTPQSGAKISTKIMTLNNDRQKVNDALGNPIVIGAVVIWNVQEPTKAVLNVEDYREYLSIQCDSTIRNVARLYPYDIMEEDSDEKTLRGSSQEIAERMKQELQGKVLDAGLRIEEVRITHLAYAEEVAAAMLQRQQAAAIIAARQKIVEGAVSMVKMAIQQLGEEEIVVLDEERKAAMVSNMLVVLCGNKDAQPIVNSGSIY